MCKVALEFQRWNAFDVHDLSRLFYNLNLGILLTYGKNLKPNDQEFIDSLQQYEFIEPKLSEPFTVQNTRHQQVSLITFNIIINSQQPL